MATRGLVGRTAAARRSGFTLVEILIVVVIIGIMAAIVAPRFNYVVREVRAESLKEQLREVRTVVQLYRLQHVDAAPALNGRDWTDLTQAKPHADGRVCGPYLKSVPRNQMNRPLATETNGLAFVVPVCAAPLAGTDHFFESRRA